MTEIILIRHGETEWNVAKRFRGRIDIELSQTGLKQAELLAEYLRNAEVEAVYSSPLKRALQTAEAIACHHQLNVEIAPGLLDFDFGQWQGLSHEEVKDKYGELYDRWLENPHRWEIPGGERLADVRKRALGLVDSVIRRRQGTTVLVSHRVVNKVLICALLGLDDSHFWNIEQDTCGMTLFTYQNGRFVLTRHNDTSFLASLNQARREDF